MPYQPFMPAPQYHAGVGMPYQQLQQPMQQPMQQPVHGFVYVTGLEGAKAYQMPPNSEMPLFDSTTENRMFVKTTDGAGFPTIKVVTCTPEEYQPQQAEEYATAEDVRALHAEIDELRSLINAKHISTSE